MRGFSVHSGKKNGETRTKKEGEEAICGFNSLRGVRLYVCVYCICGVLMDRMCELCECLSCYAAFGDVSAPPGIELPDDLSGNVIIIYVCLCMRSKNRTSMHGIRMACA